MLSSRPTSFGFCLPWARRKKRYPSNSFRGLKILELSARPRARIRTFSSGDHEARAIGLKIISAALAQSYMIRERHFIPKISLSEIHKELAYNGSCYHNANI